MRSGAIALSGVFVMLTLPAFAQSSASDSMAQIEKCIRQNAPRVEAAVPDLKHAVSFLINDICALPIANESARLANEQLAVSDATLKKTCDAEKASKGDASESYICAVNRNEMAGTYRNVSGDTPGFTGQASPAMTALAAKLLLDLRLAHQKSEAPH